MLNQRSKGKCKVLVHDYQKPESLMQETAVQEKSGTALLDRMRNMGHEQVLFCNDAATGLKAIIAIHDTTLGPALGGTRMWNYANEAEALEDVLRLSRGMTYKSALAGLDLGGGKAVIIGDSKTQKTEAMFRRFGRFVESLNGQYITAEDMGMTLTEMVNIKKETDYVAGLPKSIGGSGNPSPVTAYGVFMGLKAAAKRAYGSDDLSGRKVSVQGLGNVGFALCELLHKDGAKLVVTDIHEGAVKRAVEALNATAVAPDAIYDQEVDIYSPCAMGATVNDDTLTRLKCSVIAGAANNQLAEETKHGQALVDKGILYAPDFLVNAGGIINCFWELKGFVEQAAMDQCAGIYDTALQVFEESEATGTPSYVVANRIAERRINAVKNSGLSYS